MIVRAFRVLGNNIVTVGQVVRVPNQVGIVHATRSTAHMTLNLSLGAQTLPIRGANLLGFSQRDIVMAPRVIDVAALTSIALTSFRSRPIAEGEGLWEVPRVATCAIH
jgi:hypothetical protein